MPGIKFSTPDVNLLAGDDFENQTQGKFLHWALTWGKRIVVLTELLVIMAFLSRFWLDTTVADLNEKISQKKAIVSFSLESEDRFRQLSDKVKKITLIENDTSLLKIYDQFAALIPTEVNITQIKVAPTEVSISGASDETKLSTLVNNFKASKNFVNITVEKISKKEVGVDVEFTMKANYVK